MTPRVIIEQKPPDSPKRCSQCQQPMHALPTFVTHAVKPMYCRECEKVEFAK